MQRLMGMEIELGIASYGEDGEMRAGSMATTLLRQAGRSRPHLPHASNGIFFDTGDRFYVDQGAHPEWCTPECADMSDVVRHVRAAETRLEALLREMPKVMLLRSNIDYASRTTWGCHESHLHRVDRELLAPVLIPHLVSRIIYSGAGGLNPYEPGIAPCLSPRAMNFWRRSSCSRISLYDLRDEPLAGLGYQRCHIVLGDTLCTDLPLWLRLGATSLVIAMADAGAITPGNVPDLESPVAALHAFCTDTSLTAVARTKAGEMLTAVDVQFRYLEAAERFVGNVAAPAWTAEVCEQWRVMLERLRQGPDAVATTCEWAIKRTIFTDQATRAGFDGERRKRVGALVRRLHEKIPPDDSTLVRRLAPAWSVRQRLEKLEPIARRAGADFDELRAFFGLRQRLCEIDTRYGQLPGGLFAAIARGLDHAAPRVDAAGVRRAMTEPPPDTRAALRGSMIRKLSVEPEGLFADWTRIDDRRRGRSFVMHDPFSLRSEWTARRVSGGSADRMLNIVSHHYNRGNFNRVSDLLDVILARTPGAPPAPAWVWAYRAWVDSRSGDVARAEAALEQVRGQDEEHTQIVDRVSIYRFQGLTPRPRRMTPWIRRGERADHRAWRPESLVSFLGHKGYALSREGRVSEAIAILRQALAIPLERPNHLRIAARIRCDLADCLRLTGDRAGAQEELNAAEQVFASHRFRGDQADHWTPAAVKLAPDAPEARDLLSQAHQIQRRLGHPVGAVRTLLLRARITRHRAVATRARHQIERDAAPVPDLRRCPRLKKILTRWDEWAMGYPAPVVDGDSFWMV